MFQHFALEWMNVARVHLLYSKRFCLINEMLWPNLSPQFIILPSANVIQWSFLSVLLWLSLFRVFRSHLPISNSILWVNIGICVIVVVSCYVNYPVWSSSLPAPSNCRHFDLLHGTVTVFSEISSQQSQLKSTFFQLKKL